MPGTVRLQTQHLTLRRHTLQDAPVLHQHFGLDPEMQRYSGWNPYATEDMSLETMGRFLASYPDPRFYGWAIEHQDRLIGTLGAYDYDPNHSTIEIGLCIRRDCWSQGFAAEALAKVLDYLTGPEGIRWVTAWCARENIGSRRVMEHCGMILTRTEPNGLTAGGKTYDKLHFTYEVTK